MIHKFFLDVEPFPAERTDCTCRGRFATVYTKPRYREWLAKAKPKLEEIAPDLSEVRENSIVITVIAVRPRPKTTKLQAPLGDNDNYEKALWDAMGKVGAWWDDDRQIIRNLTVKRWAREGEAPGYHVKVRYLKEKFSK